MATEHSTIELPPAQARSASERGTQALSASDRGADEVDRLRGLVVQQEAKIASILEISNALRASRSEGELLNLIMEKISVLMDADRSTLFLIDDDGAELWTKIIQDRRTVEVRLAMGEGIAGWVAQTGQSINIKDAYRDPRFNPDVDHRTGYQTESVLCQPMRNAERRIIGVIQVLNKRHGYFTVDDELLLSAVASQAAVVIENSGLYHSVLEANYELNEARDALEQKVSQQNLLFEIQRSLTQALNIEEMAGSVAQKTLELVPSQACVITLEDDQDYVRFLARPQREDSPGEPEVHVLRSVQDDGPSALVVAQGVNYVCNDERQCMQDSQLAQQGITYRSVIAVPLFAEDQVVGCLELVNRIGVGDDGRPAEFADTDLKFLTLLAGQVAPAVATSLFRLKKEKADRLASIGQMLSSVLHDFKTPVTIISGYAQLMARAEEQETRTEFATAIKKQFSQLSQMTQEVLAFARGENTILLRKVYLHKFMADVEELLRQEFRDRDIELVVDVAYRRTAKFDEGKMKRVLFNLARNARQAMPNGGRFHIVVDANDSELVFRIADTGPGIPEDIRDRLFESFVTHGKRDGTGLGLAIVKKIVEEHNGTVAFESEPGKGTIFTIRLPLDA